MLTWSKQNKLSECEQIELWNYILKEQKMKMYETQN